jgi:hypothetical protein
VRLTDTIILMGLHPSFPAMCRVLTHWHQLVYCHLAIPI